ncbi:Leucine-rich repeat-containing 33 [Gossypium australe]|uniref:Leucine-rich repeat-containing 33 n=1 Tax=Gossypium australe TaxID=47621 RepID=A0A5B6WFP1_9ROSI|nr:Leucine-rich repeat-containing 33 [Gossypium australe]
MDPDRSVVDDAESNAPAPTQGTVPAKSRPIACSQEGEAKQAFFQMMIRLDECGCSTTSIPQVPLVLQVSDPIRLNKPPMDKIRKYGAEEF